MAPTRATTHGKRLQIVVIILSQALSDLSFGLIAPFFPGVCADRGIQHGTVGAIFMTQQVVGLLFTPLAPWLCRKLGNRAVILCTLAGEGVAALLWAAAGEVQSTSGFLAAAFALPFARALAFAPPLAFALAAFGGMARLSRQAQGRIA